MRWSSRRGSNFTSHEISVHPESVVSERGLATADQSPFRYFAADKVSFTLCSKSHSTLPSIDDILSRSNHSKLEEFLRSRSLLFRKPAMGTLVAFAVIVATSCIVGVHTVLTNYPPTILPLEDPKTVSLMMSDIFMRPYTHAGPFTIGIGAGYVIATNPFIRFRMVRLACFDF